MSLGLFGVPYINDVIVTFHLSRANLAQAGLLLGFSHAVKLSANRHALVGHLDVRYVEPARSA